MGSNPLPKLPGSPLAGLLPNLGSPPKYGGNATMEGFWQSLLPQLNHSIDLVGASRHQERQQKQKDDLAIADAYL